MLAPIQSQQYSCIISSHTLYVHNISVPAPQRSTSALELIDERFFHFSGMHRRFGIDRALRSPTLAQGCWNQDQQQAKRRFVVRSGLRTRSVLLLRSVFRSVFRIRSVFRSVVRLRSVFRIRCQLRYRLRFPSCTSQSEPIRPGCACVRATTVRRARHPSCASVRSSPRPGVRAQSRPSQRATPSPSHRRPPIPRWRAPQRAGQCTTPSPIPSQPRRAILRPTTVPSRGPTTRASLRPNSSDRRSSSLLVHRILRRFFIRIVGILRRPGFRILLRILRRPGFRFVLRILRRPSLRILLRILCRPGLRILIRILRILRPVVRIILRIILRTLVLVLVIRSVLRTRSLVRLIQEIIMTSMINISYVVAIITPKTFYLKILQSKLYFYIKYNISWTRPESETQNQLGYPNNTYLYCAVHDIIIWFIVVCRVHDAIPIIAIILYYITLHSFCILNSQYYYYHHHHYYYYYYFVLLLLFVIIYTLY